MRDKFRHGLVARLAPLLAAIVRQGDDEGVFTVDSPDDLARVLVSLLQGLNETAVALFVERRDGQLSFAAVGAPAWRPTSRPWSVILGAARAVAHARRPGRPARVVRLNASPCPRRRAHRARDPAPSDCTKSYGKSRSRGIVALDLEVRAGEVFGFLGPNGAGKTTTIRVLLDLIRPTSGRALVLGRDSHRDTLAIQARSGYLPGELSLYPSAHRARDAALPRQPARRRRLGLRRRAQRAARLRPERKVADLSSGNKRKLGLIQAFMHRPELLILDEPTSGLDPLVQHEFYAPGRRGPRDAGQTVFLSSHVLPEVQRVCDRVAFIREGKLIALEDVSSLTGRAVREIEVVFAEAGPALRLRRRPRRHAGRRQRQGRHLAAPHRQRARSTRRSRSWATTRCSTSPAACPTSRTSS